MKRKLQAQLAALAVRRRGMVQCVRDMTQRTRSALRWAMLAPAVALTASPVWAALPSVTPPTSGIGTTTCTDGDIMCYIGYYFKEFVQIAAIVGSAAYLIYFMLGSLTRWRAYSTGREDASSLKEFVLLGGLLAAVVVLLAYLATQWATT